MERISVKNKLPNKMEKVLCFYKFEPESPNVIGDNIYYGGGIWMCGTDNVTNWMPLPEEPKEDQMPEITVKIPDGDYCEDCKFMEHYDYPLVDMMGNETGNRRSGYRCRQYSSDLAVEDFGCYQKIKKCFWCTVSEEERNDVAIRWLFLYGGFNKNKEKDDK